MLGLKGTGLVLQNGIEGATPELLPVLPGASTFTFATPIPSAGGYHVTVATQPTNPTQDCTITGGDGAVDSGNVTTVLVQCSTVAFPVRGTVVAPGGGPPGAGLELALGTDILAVTGTTFAFPDLASGLPYAITVAAQPTSPAETCTVSGGTGTVGAGPVTDVVVTCVTNSYKIDVTVVGLAGQGFQLQDAIGDGRTEVLDVAPNANPTSTSFVQTVQSGTTYDA